VVHALDVLDAEPARPALVGERRIQEAIRHHDLPIIQGGQNHLGHELRARRREQERLGLGRQRNGGVLQQRPHPLSGLCPTGLTHAKSIGTKRLTEHPGLCRFSGSIDAFKGDEQAAHQRGEPSSGSSFTES
jgi:hypothetical protein